MIVRVGCTAWPQPKQNLLFAGSVVPQRSHRMA
jgi:hypothetical protein